MQQVVPRPGSPEQRRIASAQLCTGLLATTAAPKKKNHSTAWRSAEENRAACAVLGGWRTAAVSSRSCCSQVTSLTRWLWGKADEAGPIVPGSSGQQVEEACIGSPVTSKVCKKQKKKKKKKKKKNQEARSCRLCRSLGQSICGQRWPDYQPNGFTER
ncbi:hypothetical protein GY632_4232 [Trichophyton interdigitale]|uniref:Uncharacterized protein n=1 Tax=Trichophyton interdigitale TaxID=101480 RepID=A0A9P4YFY4_9EURO|nr:hypothetical protein GY632_4232 [Trichophyton interdigitale]